MRDKIHRLIGIAGGDLRIAKYPALDTGRKSIEEASETTGNVWTGRRSI